MKKTYFTLPILGLFLIAFSFDQLVLLNKNQNSNRHPASTALDFNSMIEESQKNTAELNAEFQKNAGIQKKILNAGKINKENLKIPSSSEQFTAKTSADIFSSESDSAPVLNSQDQMKRLSREMQEVGN